MQNQRIAGFRIYKKTGLTVIHATVQHFQYSENFIMMNHLHVDARSR